MAIGNDQMRIGPAGRGKIQQTVGEAKSTIKEVAVTVADKAHEKL